MAVTWNESFMLLCAKLSFTHMKEDICEHVLKNSGNMRIHI